MVGLFVVGIVAIMRLAKSRSPHQMTTDTESFKVFFSSRTIQMNCLFEYFHVSTEFDLLAKPYQVRFDLQRLHHLKPVWQYVLQVEDVSFP